MIKLDSNGINQHEPGALCSSMGLLSYTALVRIVEDGVINAPIENVNGSSIDITLDAEIMLEDDPKFNSVVNLMTGESVEMRRHVMLDGFGYQMIPGEFVLGSTLEYFKLPLNISAEFKLKSTLARNGLEHLAAGWIDPGFHGNLTLELINTTKRHRLVIAPGMKIGQIVFFDHEQIPAEVEYAARGQYQGQRGVVVAGRLK